MKRHTTHSSTWTSDRPRRLVVLIVMLALGMRLLYVPVHLAQEEHLHSSGHLVLDESESEGEAADGHGHEHEHEHDSDHQPHSALDHTCDLLVRRTPQEERALASYVPPQRLDSRLLSPLEQPAIRSPEPSPPSTRARSPVWSRGPPASA